MTSLSSAISLASRAVDSKESKGRKKIVLLIKRQLELEEADHLERVLDVTFLNERVHLERRITDLLDKCELLVIPVFKEQVKVFWEANLKLVDKEQVDVVLLERKSYKVSDPKEYACDYLRKQLPISQSKDDYLFHLLSNHFSKVEPKYKRFLKGLLCCVKSVV